MKPRYQEVRGHPNLVRDTSSGAVLNINATSGSAAKKRKKKDYKHSFVSFCHKSRVQIVACCTTRAKLTFW